LCGATNTDPIANAAILYRERLILKVSTADDIMEMIASRSSHTGGVLQLSDSLDDLGLDSMEVVALTFDIEEKFNIQIPFNANMDIDSKTLGDLIQSVIQLVAAKAKPA
jgi:acyl carrier protein